MSSNIILSKNIKLDKSYNNVLNYSEEQLVNLCRSNMIAERNNYSFIRHQERNKISVDFTYSQCLEANYIAFQNKDFDNKWFFAFIDSVELVNDHTSHIYYTIDVWSTFWSDWTASKCFVIREHVADDTRGLHTVPEGLETGDYMICNETVMTGLGSNINDFCYVLASTTSWLTDDGHGGNVAREPNGGGIYNGIYAGCKYYRFDSVADIKGALNQMAKAGQLANIVCIFMAPKSICGMPTPNTDNHIYDTTLLPYTKGIVVDKWDYIGSNYNSYTPKNNKLLGYPYSFLMVSNGVGASSVYKYEDFDIDPNKEYNPIEFEADLVLCPSCSGKIIPRKFLGKDVNYDYGIPLAKYPICSFQTDAYTNWLVTNSVNILGYKLTNDEMNMYSAGFNGLQSMFGSIGQMASGDYLGGSMSAVGGMLNTGISMAHSVESMKSHDLTPPQMTLAQSTGDITMSQGYTAPRIYNVSI